MWINMSLLHTHPDAPLLALLAGGELPFWPRCQARWHVRLCPHCQAALEQFLAVRAALRAEALNHAPGGPLRPRLERLRSRDARQYPPRPDRRRSGWRTGWRFRAPPSAVPSAVALGHGLRCFDLCVRSRLVAQRSAPYPHTRRLLGAERFCCRRACPRRPGAPFRTSGPGLRWRRAHRGRF